MISHYFSISGSNLGSYIPVILRNHSIEFIRDHLFYRILRLLVKLAKCKFKKKIQWPETKRMALLSNRGKMTITRH